MANQIKELLSIIEQSTDEFINGLTPIQVKTYNRLITLLKELETDSDGNIKTNLNNIKLINSIDRELNGIVLNKTYIKSVAKFAKLYNTVDKLQDKYFAALNVEYTPLKVLEEVKKATVNTTIEQLTENGIGGNYTGKIKELLTKNITSGGSYADMTAMLKKTIVGDPGKDGKLVSYAKQIVIDSINQYNRTYTKTITNDLGLEWYQYTGTLLTTSRQFCILMVAKRYFHVSEIPTLLSGNIDGVQVDMNEKTGLPEGMIEGTNESNFITNLGGYQCGHTVFPVITESVPKDKREKLFIVN
jgi:hypothetical protein